MKKRLKGELKGNTSPVLKNILKGSLIGNDSIVGTHAVVAGLKCPEGSVVAGNPARIVKQGIHWDKKRL